jgi:hypothetical protein
VYEDIIATILGDLTPQPPPGQAMAGALRGQPTLPGGMPMMQPPAQPIPPPDLPPTTPYQRNPMGPPPNQGQPLPPGPGGFQRNPMGPPSGPPPQQGGAGGTWGPPMPPQAPPSALPRATGMRAQGAPGGPGGGPGASASIQAAGGPAGGLPAPSDNDSILTRQEAELRARQAKAEELATNAYKPVDRGAMDEAFQRRGQGADQQLLMALAAQQAGESFSPMQAHFLKQSAAAREPMKMRGGTLTGEGFIEDPDYQTEINIRRADAQIKSIDQALAANLSAQERRRLEKEKQEWQGSLQRSQQAFLAAQAGQASADRRYAADLAHQDRQATAGAKAAGKEGKGNADPQATLNYLDRADELLKSATGSGAGALVDKGANFFGYGTEGAKAGGALKTTAAALTMNVPRMEGPQSDKDTQMYKEAAGNLADDTLPVSVRQAAAKEMRRIANNYKSGYWAPQGYKPPKGFTVDSQGGNQGLPPGWGVTQGP